MGTATCFFGKADGCPHFPIGQVSLPISPVPVFSSLFTYFLFHQKRLTGGRTPYMVSPCRNLLPVHDDGIPREALAHPMDQPLFMLLLFIVGVIAGVLNVMAGGGSAITLPMLIFMGLDSPLANGTNRLAVFIQCLATVISFRREKYSDLRTSMRLAACALPGAVIGVIMAVKMDSLLFQKVLGFFILIMVATVLFPKPALNGRKPGESRGGWLIYPVMFGIGIIGGLHQVGIGFFMIAALRHLMNMDLVRINMHKAAVFFIYTIPVMVVFGWTGNIDWTLGLVLAAGNATGGWWAAKIAVRRGEKVIRVVLVLAMVIMATKLLLGF